MPSCPWFKFVFCERGDEVLRIGPRMTVSECRELCGDTLHISGISFRGRGREVFPHSLVVDLSGHDGSTKVFDLLTAELLPDDHVLQIDN